MLRSSTQVVATDNALAVVVVVVAPATVGKKGESRLEPG